MEISINKNQWEILSHQSLKLIDFLESYFEEIISNGMNENTMREYNSQQITLIAYLTFRHEMLEGGMVQLIYNGYGPFIFLNPFAKALRQWGLKDFSNYIYDLRRLYETYRDGLEGKDLSEEDFMSLYEQHPKMELEDDEFIDMEPQISCEIANFVIQNQTEFGLVIE